MDIRCLIHNCLTPDIERVPHPRYRRGNDDAIQTPYWGVRLLLNYDVDHEGKKELERIICLEANRSNSPQDISISYVRVAKVATSF